MATEVLSCTAGTLCSGPLEEEHDTCWICLDGPKDGHPLVKPCSCPRTVHAACLAKWQLTSAGRNEETRCRFCNSVLPDWRPALTPSELKPAASVMSVRYRGVTHKITYNPGPDGLQHFLETLQSIGIKVASASQVTFLCRSPDNGEEMALKGLEAFDAAAYCASITAAKRVIKEAKRQQAPAPSTPDTGCSSGSDLGVRPEGPESPTAARSCERHVAHVHAEAFPHGDDWGPGQAHSRGSSFDASSSSSSGGRGGHTDQDHHRVVAGQDSDHHDHQQQQQGVAAAAEGSQQRREHHHANHLHWWLRLLGCIRQLD